MSLLQARLIGGGGAGPLGPRLPILAGFCSHSFLGRPWFDIFLPALTPSQRQQLYALKRRAGITHIQVQQQYSYGTSDYWLPGGALDDAAWVALIREVLANGFRPIVYLDSGDHGRGFIVYDGTLRHRCRVLADAGLAGEIIVLVGHETFGKSAQWTAKENSDAWLLMRAELGDDVLIGAHVDSIHPTRFTPKSWDPEQPDDPFSAEDAAWFEFGGAEVDIFFHQLPLNSNSSGPIEEWDQGPPSRTWHGLQRLLPPGTIYDGVPIRTQPDEHGSIPPYWMARPRRRGPMHTCGWEYGVAYPYIRGHMKDDEVARIDRRTQDLGVVSRGSMPAKE